MIDTYNLNPYKIGLGINLKTFFNTHQALIMNNSIFEREYVLNLLEYKRDQQVYIFENENFAIVSETLPTIMSSSFLSFKWCKFNETNNSINSTIYFKNIDNIPYLSFKSFRIDLNCYIEGILISSKEIESKLFFAKCNIKGDMFFCEYLAYLSTIDSETLELFFNEISIWSLDKLKKYFLVYN